MAKITDTNILASWDDDFEEIAVSCDGSKIGAINFRSEQIVFISENAVLTTGCILQLNYFMQSLEKDLQSIESFAVVCRKKVSANHLFKTN